MKHIPNNIERTLTFHKKDIQSKGLTYRFNYYL